jgi:hypothetical protein
VLIRHRRSSLSRISPDYPIPAPSVQQRRYARVSSIGQNLDSQIDAHGQLDLFEGLGKKSLLAVPANAYQDDLYRKAAVLEHGQAP